MGAAIAFSLRFPLTGPRARAYAPRREWGLRGGGGAHKKGGVMQRQSMPHAAAGGVARAALLVLLVGVTIPSPALAVGELDTTGCYAFSDTTPPLDGNAPTFAFVDISGTGTRLLIGDDELLSVPIGFEFNYYG